MNKWIGSVLLLGFGLPLFAQPYPQAEEIVIEMYGEEESSPRTGVSIWDKNAKQLTKIFRGKDRTTVLYQVENVSSRDDIVRSTDSKEYAYVRYGRDDGNYRKFLFKAENPQTFLACAANLQDVLAINKKYKLNLGVHRADFLRSYEDKAILTYLSDKAHNKTYESYQVEYSDINHKKPQPHFFVFEADTLLNWYDNDKDYYQFVNQLSKENREIRAKEKEAEKERQLAEQKEYQAAQARANRPVRKALVSGGTVRDQMYMPKAVNAKPLPALTPSKTPAGTPLPTNPF